MVVKNRGAKSIKIAESMNISEHTLRNHLTVIYDKLNLRNRLDLFAYAIEHRLAVVSSMSTGAAGYRERMPLTVPTDREEKIWPNLPGCSGDRRQMLSPSRRRLSASRQNATS